jgi:energy-coupling factor transport system permease protein
MCDCGGMMKKIDPRLKIYLVIINLILVLLISSPVSLGTAVVFTAVVVYMSRIKPYELLKSVGFVLATVLIVFLILCIWIKPVTALYGFLKCSMIVLAGVVFSKTTEQVDVFDGLVGAFHLRASTAKWVYLSLDFLPQLRYELDRMKTSRVARGERPEGKGFLRSVYGDVRVFGPAWKNTNVKSKRTAKAMDDRCYDVSTRRIRTKPLKMKGLDFLCLAITFIYAALVVYFEVRIRVYGKLI